MTCLATGDLVGEVEGFDVGAGAAGSTGFAVGCLEGLVVNGLSVTGLELGAFDGLSVTVSVGLSVIGLLLGCVDGLNVTGFALGAFDGLSVTGTLVGEDDGEEETGDALGGLNGAVVGASVEAPDSPDPDPESDSSKLIHFATNEGKKKNELQHSSFESYHLLFHNGALF